MHGNLAEPFKKNLVSGAMLLRLDSRKLQALGVDNQFHREALLERIGALRVSASMASASTATSAPALAPAASTPAASTTAAAAGSSLKGRAVAAATWAAEASGDVLGALDEVAQAAIAGAPLAEWTCEAVEEWVREGGRHYCAAAAAGGGACSICSPLFLL